MSGEKDLSLFSVRLTFVKSVRPCAFNDMIFMLVGNIVFTPVSVIEKDCS